MRTPMSALRYLAALLAIAAQGLFLNPLRAQDSISNLVPVVSIRATVPETSEPLCDPDLCDAPTPAPGVFVVSRRGGDLNRELPVFLRYEGTATSGSDYTPLPTSIHFPAGASNVELFVESTHDILPEGDETVNAQLLPDPTVGPLGLYRLDPTQTVARVVILDNDLPLVPIVSIRASVPETREPLCPPNTCLAPVPAPGVFVVSRSGGDLAQGLSVWVRYAGTGTSGADYVALPEWVQFPAGLASVELLVRANFDGLSEGDETVLAELQPDPSLGPIERYRVDPAQAAARVVIHDNETPPAPVVGILPLDSEASEVWGGAIFSDPASFRVVRTGDLRNELVVFLSAQGTAVWWGDYQLYRVEAGPAVRFPSGSNSVTVWLIPRDDSLVEGDETAFLQLIAPPAGTPLADSYAVDPQHSKVEIVIHDNDPNDPNRPQLEITAPRDGQHFRVGDPIELSARLNNAGSDNLWSVTFFDEDSPIGGVLPGAVFVWTGATAGEHFITAVAQSPVSVPGDALYSQLVTIFVEATPEPVVSIEATSPIAEESSYPYRRLAFRGRFTISRTGSTEHGLPVFVHYSGTATPGVDYPFLPWLVTIPAGTNRAEIEVVPNPDDKPEPIETVEATLSECPPLTDPPLGIPCYLVNIDPAHSSARVFIRDDGITTASLEITAPKNGAEFADGTAIHITATAIDLEGAITYVQFFDGDTKIGESIINFFRAPDPGTPIQHEFEWRGAAAGPHVLTARALNAAGNAVTSAPVRVSVGGGLPVVSIEATVPETTEPSPTTRVRPGVFTFRRTGDASRTLRVWTHYGGTATSGADYVALPTVVEFPMGAASIEVLIAPLDDQLAEGDETVIGQLTPSPLAVVPEYSIDPVNNQARVIIHDNDAPDRPLVSIRATQPFTAEPCPVCLVAPGMFTISRTGNTDAPLGVWYLLGGTALNGVDYLRLPGQAIIPAGREAVEVLVLPILDNVREGEETVVAQLVIPPVGALIDPYRIDPEHHTATVIIRDSVITPPGPPIVSIRATDPLAREGTNNSTGSNTATFVVSRTDGTNDPLAVYFNLGGTASNGVDYAAVSSPVVIPAGRHSARLIITPIDDRLPEPIETVVVTLLPSADDYVLGRPYRAAAIIVDNDYPRPPCVRLPDGLFNLCVPVDVYNCFRVESTRDLKVWAALCTVPVNDGAAHYIDPDAADLPHQFYRLVPVPCDLEE